MTQIQPNLIRLRPAPLDAESEALLKAYTGMRLDQGAARSTVSSERSQLRVLLRDSMELGGSGTLAELVMDPASVATALACPCGSPSRATVLTRLRAFQRLCQLGVAAEVHRTRLDALDERLPARFSRGWYDAGIAVGGTRATHRRRAPTIEPRELVEIMRRGGAGSTEGAALLGVLCFSGLRVGEVRTLRWPSLRWNGAAESWDASVRRKGRRGLRFLIVGPGAHALTNWRLESIPAQQEAVFGAQRNGEPLSERGFMKRVAAALKDAGSPSTHHAQIQSAFAAWLHESGLTDHEIKVVMGRREVRSVDRLLFAHRALAAQRQLAEQMEGAPLGSGSIGSH